MTIAQQISAGAMLQQQLNRPQCHLHHHHHITNVIVGIITISNYICAAA